MISAFNSIEAVTEEDFGKMDCQSKYCSQDKIINDTFDTIHQYNNYLSDKQEEYRLFYLNNYAYLFKLDLKEKIDKYDFIWSGNMGYYGEREYISEIKEYCDKNKCMFILDQSDLDIGSWVNKDILEFVEKEYTKYLDDGYLNKTTFIVYTNDTKMNK